MTREPVESSVIKAVGYDEDAAVLEVQFPDGDVYRYFEFPAFLYRGLMLAASKGHFFNTRIAGRYRYERVAAHGVVGFGGGEA
ncbi:MAG TPA: KTSC domain-containing protein [Vicinamibacterales bacterium]|nr:KTSC domain-containing protein [Vicinamibacterales bacterium]